MLLAALCLIVAMMPRILLSSLSIQPMTLALFGVSMGSTSTSCHNAEAPRARPISGSWLYLLSSSYTFLYYTFTNSQTLSYHEST